MADCGLENTKSDPKMVNLVRDETTRIIQNKTMHVTMNV
jgi:hypothetical protein